MTPYKGTRRKLVLAFDIGTNPSILEPGQAPEIKPVTRFPASETISAASKIPTIIYYDQEGKIQAVGAEATKEGILEEAEDRDWVKAEWFKLHLHSNGGRHLTQDLPPLPCGKTIIDIFADFLRYLFQCTQESIQDTYPNGHDLWASLKNEIAFVLSHPNSWEAEEQHHMRQAAVLAKLITDSEAGHVRVILVAEGEACLHYALQSSFLSTTYKAGTGVVIVDAGGATIDIISYSQNVDGTFEEIAVPHSSLTGSVLVSVAARHFLKERLRGSAYINDLGFIIERFDQTTKLRFNNPEEYQYIIFGSPRYNDLRYSIRSGRLKLEGSDVALFFNPSIQSIIYSVLKQAQRSHNLGISHVVLVGGLASNDWVFRTVAHHLTELDMSVVRPESYVHKAVSDGAISFYLDYFVQSRVSKVSYGCFGAVPFDPEVPQHQEHRSKGLFTMHSGELMIDNAFLAILPKNTRVSEEKRTSGLLENCPADCLADNPPDNATLT